MTIYKSIKKTIMNKLTLKFILCWIYTIVVPASIIYIYIKLLTDNDGTSLTMKILSFIVLIAIIISSIAMSVLLKVKLIPRVEVKLKYNLSLGIYVEDEVLILLPFMMISLTPKKHKS